MSMHPLLSTADEIPPAAVLLERLRAENKQPCYRVEPCLGCGGMPHGGVGEETICIESALKKAREENLVLRDVRGQIEGLKKEVARLTELTERQDRMMSNRSLQLRGHTLP